MVRPMRLGNLIYLRRHNPCIVFGVISMRNGLILVIAFLLFGAAYAQAGQVTLELNPVSLPAGEYAYALATTEPGAEVCFSAADQQYNVPFFADNCTTANSSGRAASWFMATIPGEYTVYAFAYGENAAWWAVSEPESVTFYEPEPACPAVWLCTDSTHKAYQNADCMKTQITYCPYGCSSGVCKPAPATTPTKMKLTQEAAIGVSYTMENPLLGGVLLAGEVAVITYGFLRREY